MSRVQHPPDAEAPRKYGAYQMQIYTNGLLKNILPTVTTDPNKLEEQAKKTLGARSYNYVAGGAGERATMDANRLAFRQWKVKIKKATRVKHSAGIVHVPGVPITDLGTR